MKTRLGLLVSAFTLIVPMLPAPGLVELGTVTAIQGELSAGAAQSGMFALDRTRLGTVNSELQGIKNALEMYRADNGAYPVCARMGGPYGFAPNDNRYGSIWSFVNTAAAPNLPGNLQTPNGYLSSVTDPYSRFTGRDLPYGYYIDRRVNRYLLWSAGPDNDYDIDPVRDFDSASAPPNALQARIMDPANPNDEDGDIILVGP